MSRSLLSDRQKEELHLSMLDYLSTNSTTFSQQLIDSLKLETKLPHFTLDSSAKHAGLLEKKWTSVIRLQKKIMELENRNAQLLQQLASSASASASSSSNQHASSSRLDWLPSLPATHSLSGHSAPITALAFHPLFNLIASACEDASIRIWDWDQAVSEKVLKGHSRSVQDLHFDSKGVFLVSCSSDSFIKLWDSSNEWKNTRTLKGHEHSVSSVRYLPGDDFIVSCGRDRTIRMWEVATGFCVKTFQGHSEWILTVSPSSDGRQLVTSSIDHTSRVWDAQTGESKIELRGHDHVVEVALFAPLAAYAAIRTLAGIVRETRGKEKDTVGRYVATGSRDKTIKLWDASHEVCLATFVGHDSWVRALLFHPSGTHLLSSSDDKSIKLWDLSTGRCTKTLQDAGEHFVTCLSWGRILLPASAAKEKENGKEEEEREGRVINVLASAGVDCKVRIWTP